MDGGSGGDALLDRIQAVEDLRRRVDEKFQQLPSETSKVSNT